MTLKALVWFLVLKNNENLFQERALVATKTTTSMVLALRLSRWEDSKGRPWSVTLARCSSVPDGVKMAMAQSNVHADKYRRQTYRNTNDMELAHGKLSLPAHSRAMGRSRSRSLSSSSHRRALQQAFHQE